MKELRVERVLAPVDLGHSSEAALRCAETLASALGASLTLMYVNDALTLQSYDEIFTGYRDVPDEQLEMMQDAVREWASPIIRATRYDVIVVADDPVTGIVTTAERHDADLIIMGTHGRHGWQRLIGGSIAEAVLQMTDRPVITVPQSADITLSDIVCPVNFTDVAHRAARMACSMSSTLGARLHVVHVAERSVANLEHRVREWVGGPLGHEPEIHEILGHGHAVAEKVVEFARQTISDVIIVGADRRRKHGLRATIGTTTERIMRISPTAVMSVVPSTGKEDSTDRRQRRKEDVMSAVG